MQAANDWAQAAQMLCDHSLSLTLDGQAGTVRALLRSFPARMSEQSPELTLVQAIADLYQMHLEDAAARIDIARSYAATMPPDRQHRLDLVVASLDLLLARLRGHFDGVFKQVDTLPSPGADSSISIALGRDLRALALMNLGATQAWSLRLRESESLLLEGAALARDIGRPYLEVACLAYLGFASTIHSVVVARRRCEEAIERAAAHGWDDQPVIAPALAALAGMLIWTGECGDGERWLERALRATQAGAEPGIRLLLCLTEGMLQAAHGRHHEALERFTAAERVQALMVGEHALTVRVIGWTAATQARLGLLAEAHATLAGQALVGEIRNALAVICLAEGDPGGARGELAAVVDGTALVGHDLTLVEAHLLDALACRDQGDERAVREALERALNLAEPDRLILPFAMTGAWKLLEALPPHGTSHAALIADILQMTGGTGARTAGTPTPGAEELSPSELRVLRFLPTNLTRPEIAAELSVSLNTVNSHVRKIYAKLGVTDRSSAVQRAREQQLLAPRRGR